MSVLLAILLVYLPLTLGYVLVAARPGERRYLAQCTVAAWLLLGTLTYAVHGWIPYYGGRDDELYLELARLPYDSFLDLFVVGRFTGLIDQPGYPWILNMLFALVGHDFLAFKFSNLCLLILISQTWYAIARSLDSIALGRLVAVGVLLLTPLWYYVFFLFKDMFIAFLQGVFVLGLVRQWIRPSLGAVLLMIVPTLALVLLRAPLVISNVAVILAVSLAKLVASGSAARRIYMLALSGVVIVAALALVSNPELMFKLGIYQKGRVLEAGATMELIQDVRETSEIRWQLFPALYLLSETAGLNAKAWESLGAPWLRGVLAIPWILFVVPYFLVGCLWLLKPADADATRGFFSRIRNPRALATPWSAILVFIASTAGVSWISGDTTRWRIADMPAILTVAAVAWLRLGPNWRWKTLALWILAAGFALSGLYLLKEI